MPTVLGEIKMIEATRRAFFVIDNQQDFIASRPDSATLSGGN
jgi:hypothetical protein